MKLLTKSEAKLIQKDIKNIIKSFNLFGLLFRVTSNSSLYGSDKETFNEIDKIKVELIEASNETLSGKIDAITNILPEIDVKLNDRLKINETTYRIQTIENINCFGILTHKKLKLVKLYDN